MSEQRGAVVDGESEGDETRAWPAACCEIAERKPLQPWTRKNGAFVSARSGAGRSRCTEPASRFSPLRFSTSQTPSPPSAAVSARPIECETSWLLPQRPPKVATQPILCDSSRQQSEVAASRRDMTRDCASRTACSRERCSSSRQRSGETHWTTHTRSPRARSRRRADADSAAMRCVMRAATRHDVTHRRSLRLFSAEAHVSESEVRARPSTRAEASRAKALRIVERVRFSREATRVMRWRRRLLNAAAASMHFDACPCNRHAPRPARSRSEAHSRFPCHVKTPKSAVPPSLLCCEKHRREPASRRAKPTPVSPRCAERDAQRALKTSGSRIDSVSADERGTQQNRCAQDATYASGESVHTSQKNQKRATVDSALPPAFLKGVEIGTDHAHSATLRSAKIADVCGDAPRAAEALAASARVHATRHSRHATHSSALPLPTRAPPRSQDALLDRARVLQQPTRASQRSPFAAFSALRTQSVPAIGGARLWHGGANCRAHPRAAGLASAAIQSAWRGG
eukprot:2343479-Pleurochrysis_carterae.AAC.2